MSEPVNFVRSRADFLAARAKLPGAQRSGAQQYGESGTVGVVLTMGALHDGHAALMDAARAECDSVVATVFINPLQFGDPADLNRYPRTLDADVAIAQAHGVDLLWAPGLTDVYTAGEVEVTINSGPLGQVLEGAARPGHFDGMLTVVAKFLSVIRPDRAYFGEKDYQQLTLIRRMVADLDLGPRIVGVPTVREADGLALSSRNVFLSAAERAQSLALCGALEAGRDAAAAGERAVVSAAQRVLAAAGVTPDYLALRGSDLGQPRAGEAARLLVAAKLGATRLIDNIQIDGLRVEAAASGAEQAQS
ncbi:pantothenate synthetase [Jatrophihabitans sp. GAS493]|uniref:pantoate--beta-alanine ligase n=1 Tax=Jatrophihabitans sp. GAS493 TaxID=1907575 RepID=UPI000BB97BBE|nr:pantoate--beta-alanine ligase [Jatrophihabitans sp. GAS493]SOD70552.1 pantothenate synthetase [Jatrophihabitans sp. GAS493]